MKWIILLYVFVVIMDRHFLMKYDKETVSKKENRNEAMFYCICPLLNLVTFSVGVTEWWSRQKIDLKLSDKFWNKGKDDENGKRISKN